MKVFFTLPVVATIYFWAAAVVTAISTQQQRAFMAPDSHGDIWSLCDNPSTHQLIGYEDGVYIFPEQPQTGENINVRVKGNLMKDVTGGKVDIDLNIMGMIKIKKQLELCSVLSSEVMNHKACPLKAGDTALEATAWIPKELPKLPLSGNVRISDQDGQTVTCIHLDFKLQ
ncbi:hypothetical protein BDF20DRAFT_852496 [Mycotypha africana]|uniref:uncharacterized protein n=1 Tax=Mycotypha africana TaxID=64632 RepID=UPI002301BE04|nr:uncharacterized protein BDF20DRAFT_852496 [Mycotypha africana]KAI8987840.1 hypothetical protein BDF20DRAFT_852496 [Mycotypha africana]